MSIHTFGDSHCYFGWDNIDNIKTHHLGPKLCFSVGRDGINIKDGFGIKDNDIVIFSFGEIDCRCHINKHISDILDYKQIIDSIIENYFIQIKIAVDNLSNVKTVIYNVVPPVKKKSTSENKEFPFLGTDNERKNYVLYFNEKLKQKCIEYNYIFFDIYNNYIDEEGFLKKKLSDGHVHIKDEIYIKLFIEKNLTI